jgi:hypothetical protein
VLVELSSTCDLNPKSERKKVIPNAEVTYVEVQIEIEE